MGWRDFVPDSVEDWAEDRAEDVGDAIEWTGDKVADVAEDVGLDGAGDWVRDKSRSAANQLGADVAELELGQTEDPSKLVYGSVSKIRAQVSHLNDFKSSFTMVGNGLKGLAGDGLKGASADAFREAVAKEPPRWFKASEAFGKAADAMGRFAETVEWAQVQAKEALEEYNKAKKVSQDARNAYNKSIEVYKDAVEAKKDTLPPRPSDDFTDPGVPLAKAAQDKLDTARKQRNEVAETARTAVRTARDAAPPKPSYSEQLKDGTDYLDLAQTHLAGGVLKGTAGVVNFVRSVNPLDPYNVTHPAEYRTSLNSTVAGLVVAVNDPMGAGKQMLDQFMKDPSEGIGKLIPELIGTKGLGASKKAASVAKVADDITGPGRKSLDSDGPHKSDKPDCDKRCDGTDPIDLATGRMFLPQTDIVLPGTLPLVFTRRAESGYTAGRWFGPSWSSTIDQHLEIDPEGIVLVTEDGLVVAYPHPAPGVPVLPVSASAPRRPLERTQDGDWTLTDPTTGQIRRFSAPAGGPDGDGIAPITQLEDRNGNLIIFEYDPHGTPLGIAHSGYHLGFETANGRITALHLTGGPRILAYGYTDGHLTEIVNSSGLPLCFTYDERGRITSWTDTNDRSYTYAYDDEDRCIAERGTEGHMSLRVSYEARDPETGYRVTTTTDGAGHTRRYLVDQGYRVVQTVGAQGAVTRSAYDARGRLASRTDQLGRTTVFGRDEEGRLVSVVRPDGRELTTEYDEAGQPVLQAKADRTAWRFTYDERGNRTSRTGPVGGTTHYTYDASGGLRSVTGALGGTTRIRCDRAGLPIEITDPVGAVTRYERDLFGRAVRITDALGNTTALEWTTEGQLARRVEPDGSAQEWRYDGESNCITQTDALGGTTIYEYGPFDMVRARTAPDGARYTFAYDSELRLTEVVNPQGLSWRYTYDAAGMPESETDFDGRTLRYVHDTAGRLVGRVNALGQTVRLEYDVLDKRILKDADGEVTRYEYDHSDRLAAATGPGGRMTYLRDRFGRIHKESVDGRTLTRTYDELSRLVSRTTPAGATAEWTYDAAGHRTGLTTSGRRIDFERDVLGRETARRVSDAVVLDLVRDDLGRLVDQRVTRADGRVLQRRGYSYRADGHLLAVEDHLGGARTYEADPVGRVTGVSAAHWTERYAYDAAGNQTMAEWPTDWPGGSEATGPRSYDGTRLTGAGRVRYECDAMGRITLRQCTRLSRKPDTWRYQWDVEDRLTAVTTPDGTLWTYTYDAIGRRSAKRRMAADGVTVAEEVTFVWDGMTLCEQTTTGPELPHGVTLTWDHDGLQPLAQTDRLAAADGREIASRFFAIVTDLIGTPQELVDEAGEIAWRTRSTVWGTTTWNAKAHAYTPLRFPGQYFDPESGLHYNCFRYYDPETARYLSIDPLGLGPAPNASTYVTNPLTWSDALGLAPDCPPKVGRNRDEAKAQALRDAGVPEGLEPWFVDEWVPGRTAEWQGAKQLMGPDHQPIHYTEEWYELPNGDIVVYQDHWFGHQKPGEPGYQPPHVHMRPGENTRNGQIPGVEEHYYYDLE
ncbi:putative T7SS-secreted protein [Streptomyces sp. NPDC003038]|uniref:putative T7SS-secreted protein n=1 Tax=unclassified Streptomyces TaxID=2593676 RepID=UPI0033A5DB73